jgi:hypothetical protein
MPNNPADVANGAPNAESYTDNGDGTVTDNVTGLMWQQSGPFPSLAQPDAIASCPTLGLGDHHDWRLPTMIELMSVVAYGSPGAVDGATINATFFPSTPRGDFWSATAPSAASTAWTVSFGNGGYFTREASQHNSVRCVRTASALPAGGRYAVTDGTVHDNGTMLTWQRVAPTAQYLWVDARDYCAALGATLDGSGWRLPTIKELITIFDPSQASTTTADIDATAFPGTIALGYWSATLNTSAIPIGSMRSLVNFGGGGVVAGDTGTHNYVRCVR